jgi:nucleotide-binding universal stress UspA family protein
MERFQRILVALARRASDAPLLRYARMVAGLVPGAMFHFAHVDERGSTPTKLSELEESVASHFAAAAAHDCRIASGHREDELLRLAMETSADMILLGHQPSHSSRRALARRLAMKAPCSIWMVPNGSPADVRRILAAVDFSPASAEALVVATSIAQRRGLASCEALHVYFETSLAGVDEYRQDVRGREQEAFNEFLRGLELHGIEVQPRFEESPNVSHAITRAVAEDRADLVVMGTRGMSRSASILLGSQSEHTIMEIHVPILVVKKKGERLGFLKLWLEHSLGAHPGPRFG